MCWCLLVVVRCVVIAVCCVSVVGVCVCFCSLVCGGCLLLFGGGRVLEMCVFCVSSLLRVVCSVCVVHWLLFVGCWLSCVVCCSVVW